ncbi:hypothetical protein [Rivularia sp. UHCC 0363]|uniref:hypothetical protein n=1 Tax=Rivularia sp. UHCC 0363 TaxID=3110244 RepID=UPI002B214A1E|nr:hypothetical protein [Rivularia sp. UHCC 0363]MEA5593454.1 hypothetical protein [Rivularia sp. UHCC 0363]
MSDSKSFDEALDALYQSAKASADFIKVSLTSEDIDFNSAYKERLKVALSVLKITWLNEDDEEEEYEDDEDDEDDDELSYIISNN